MTHPYCARYPSPLGDLTLASDGCALTGLWMDGQIHFPDDLGEFRQELPIFQDACRWLNRYFAGDQPSPAELSLAPPGSPFRQAVWEQLLHIPYGTAVTYGQVARLVNCASAQAVGGAVGHNPISIIIPCHRVVGADGALIGYDGGLARKRWLLTHEGVQLSKRNLQKS